MEPLLSMRNISKSFPGVKALDDVSLSVKTGEVLCIAGENGAGKSTLIKVLAGIYIPEEGEIAFDGRPCRFQRPIDALEAGISVVHQEHKLVENLTVAENIFFGNLPLKPLGFVDYKKLYRDTEEIIDKLQLSIHAKCKVDTLTSAQSQMVEIAKAYSRNARLMVLDEPSSSITDTELNVLTALINQLKAEGRSFIYISHKLREIFDVGDRVAVLKDGQLVGVRQVEEMTVDSIVSMMVGRDVGNIFQGKDRPIGEEVLQVQNLCNNLVKNVSFSIRKGEIVGFAGLVGAGRSEIAESIFGYRKKSGGTVRIKGREVDIRTPKAAIRNRIGFVTEDRKKTGAIQEKSVGLNITFADLDEFTRHGFIQKRKEEQVIRESIDKLGIKTPSASQEVQYLSGGNQQKVILAKWLLTQSEVLICDEPTKGIDVGTKQEFYTILDTLARQGVAIMLISSELPEIIGLSNRVYVMRNQEIRAELRGDDINEETIAHYAMID